MPECSNQSSDLLQEIDSYWQEQRKLTDLRFRTGIEPEPMKTMTTREGAFCISLEGFLVAQLSGNTSRVYMIGFLYHVQGWLYLFQNMVSRSSDCAYSYRLTRKFLRFQVGQSFSQSMLYGGCFQSRNWRVNNSQDKSMIVHSTHSLP